MISCLYGSTAYSQYCTTNLFTTGCNSQDYINSFSTTGGSTNITNNNSGCNGGASGYTFFNTQTHTTIQGTTVNFSFTNCPIFAEGYKIWVDFNGDADFIDPGEEVYASTATIAGGATVTGNFTVPMTAVPGNTRIRIRCVYFTTTFTPCSNHTFGEVEDYNFLIIAATPCSGQPSAGTATANLGCPVSINITGQSLLGDLVWQWQKKSVCDTTWVNIPGATSLNYIPPISITPASYRAYVICTNGNLSDTTNVVFLPSVPSCYCASNATTTLSNEIFKVSVGVMSNSSTCVTTGGPGSVQSQYSDYTSIVPPVPLYRGESVPLSINIGSCGTNVDNATAMWIDYSNDGIFQPTERVYVSPASSNGANNAVGNFTVPFTAQRSLVRLRVVNSGTSTPSSVAACGTYFTGETEDYLAIIKDRPKVIGDSSYCSGSDVLLVATMPADPTNNNFVWVDPNGNIINNDSLFIPDAQTIHQGVYSLFTISTICNGIADTSGVTYFNLYINQTPNPPSVASSITYCQNSVPDSITYYGANVKWYDADTNLLAGQPTISTTLLGIDTFYATQTSLDGCLSGAAQIIVTVAPNAPAPTVTSPVVYCMGDIPSPLSATGQNLSWYTIPTGGLGTSIAPTPSTAGQGSFTWYVSQTVMGCESGRTPIVVNVNLRPNAHISVSRPYVCQYDTISINYFGNAIDTADYTWTFPTGATLLFGSGTGPMLVRFDSAGVRRVYLKVDNGGCAGPLAYTDVTVNTSPTFVMSLQPEVCQGELATLAVTNSSIGIDSFEWDFAGGAAYGSFPKGPYQVVWNTPGVKTVTAVAINKGAQINDIACRSLLTPKDIIVRELPSASITTSASGKVCTGDSVRFEAPYDPTNSYQWVPQQFFSEYSAATQWATIDYARFIQLNVTNRYNCRSSDSVWIQAEPCCEMAFPTAFTPNNDGRNDRFVAITPGNHETVTFRIQNRWGQRIYENTNPAIGWDGTYNGVPQDMGTYFYFVRYRCRDGKVYEQKGEFVLIR